MTTPTYVHDAFPRVEVYPPHGYDDRGFRILGLGNIAHWATKAAAAEAARDIGWDANRVERVWSTFCAKAYALHHPHGGFLTTTGYAQAQALRAAEHRTSTCERVGELRAVKLRGKRHGWGHTSEFYWWCTCGERGGGATREEARVWASAHRETAGGAR